MNLVKKKYKYIQKYTDDIHLDSADNPPMGFHTGISTAEADVFFKTYQSHLFYPHYGFSFYDNPAGDSISEKKGLRPALYRSSELMNTVAGNLVKIKTLESICKNAEYVRNSKLSLVMFAGWKNSLSEALTCISDHADTYPDPHCNTLSGKLMELAAPFDLQAVTEEDHDEVAAIYEEIQSIAVTDDESYLDFIYLTSNLPISLELSYVTARNIIKLKPQELMPLYQIPFALDGYEAILKTVYGSDTSQAPCLTLNNLRFKLTGIFPAIFCHEDGALYDLATGTVTGKRKSLVSFMLYLNEKGALDKNDLRYLV